MPIDRQRAEAFGDDPARYDRARPSYPNELIWDLLADDPRTVLDVGCGTGIASRLFQAEGREVLGVEPDSRMAAQARARGLAVEECRFEDWDARGRRFDLLTSAQAWHWVEPESGAAKGAKVLKPGGRIGVFWNHPVHPQEVMAVFRNAYGQHAPHLLEGESVALGTLRFDAAAVDPDADALRNTGAFSGIERRFFWWTRTYSTESWIDELPTHSDHRFLEAGRRDRLFDDLQRGLGRLGDSFDVEYCTGLVTAVRNR